MSFIEIYLHFIWSTKNRDCSLTSLEIREKVWCHIKSYAQSKDIHLLTVNGYHDHCHCLVSLKADQTASKIAGLLKGESSYWINKTGLLQDVQINRKFEWQEKYFVKSISPENLRNLIHYIQTQEEHHKKITFKEEVERFFRNIDPWELKGS